MMYSTSVGCTLYGNSDCGKPAAVGGAVGIAIIEKMHCFVCSHLL